MKQTAKNPLRRGKEVFGAARNFVRVRRTAAIETVRVGKWPPAQWTAAFLVSGAPLSGCVLDATDDSQSDARTVEQAASESKIVSAEMMKRRWPDGIVPIKFHRGFCSDRKERVRAALFGSTSQGACSSSNPCPGWDAADTLRLIDCEEENCDKYKYWINLIASDDNATRMKRGFKDLRSEATKSDCDMYSEDCRARDCDFDSGENCVFDVWLLKSKNNFMWRMGHELGHAFGFEHEQFRQDREDYLDLSGCDPDELRILPDDHFILDYDVQSVMQYYLYSDANDTSPKSSRCFREESGVTLVYSEETNLPSSMDLKKLQLLYGVRGDFRNNESWCINGGRQVHLGDFNGNGRTDLLCHSRKSGYNATGRRWIDYDNSKGEFHGTNWHGGSSQFCHGGDRHLVVGDFDGDNHSDVACHNRAEGTLTIDHADSEGHLDGKDWPSSGVWSWDCKGDHVRAYAGDFNANGRDDLLCHDSDSGERKIDYASPAGRFHGFEWSSSNSWCTGSKESLYVGYFDDDDSADALCHHVGDGRMRIDFAFSHGDLKGTNFDSDDYGDSFCWGSNRTLLVGDVTGDGLSDVLCHNKAIGSVSVTRADADVNWREGKGLASSSSFYDVAFCTMESSDAYIGRFGTDSREDLLCHNRKTGHTTVFYADSNGKFAIP